MTYTGSIRRLGVYDWGAHPCPASALRDELAGVDVRPVSTLGHDCVHDVENLTEAVSDARFVVTNMDGQTHHCSLLLDACYDD